MNKDLKHAQIASSLKILAGVLEVPNKQRNQVIPQPEVEEMIKDCKDMLGSLDFPKIKL